MRFYSSGDLSTGVSLAIGSGTWADLSDRNVKEAITPVNPADVLAKVAALPVATWRYKNEAESIRHMGPMAQDLYAAFQLGDSDKSITTIDADGVALAAIQGLYQLVKDQQARISAQEAEIAKLKADTTRLADCVTAINELRAQIATLRATHEPDTAVRVAAVK